jgi:pilus assembly protein CpaF
MGLLSRLQNEQNEQNEDPKPRAKLGDDKAGYIVDRGSEVQQERTREIKQMVQRRMIAELRPLSRKAKKDPAEESTDDERQATNPRPLEKKAQESMEQMRERLTTLFANILEEEHVILNRVERQRVFDQVVADILGFGPIEPLLADPAISDIMVIGPERIYVENRGVLYRTNVRFDNEEHLRHVIDRILVPVGRRVDETAPMVDARLPDGSRINVVVPPVSLVGSCLTVRKFATIPFQAHDLIEMGSATEEIFEFLRAVVSVGLNLIVSGGSSSGKTTLLNVLSSYIQDDSRVVTIENAAELQLHQNHIIRLETRPANIEGEGQLTMRDLVINALRMRPDRVIVGEVRGPEAIDLIQAMITGQAGSMGTIHSNSAQDAITRLETMCLTAGMDLPIKAIREQIATAVDIVIHMGRLRDGTRRILGISEVEGMEGDSIIMSDLFEFEQVGRGNDGEVIGQFRATGLIPRCLDKLHEAGIFLPPSVFGKDALDGQSRLRKVFSTSDAEDADLTEEELAEKYSYAAAKGKKPRPNAPKPGSLLS